MGCGIGACLGCAVEMKTDGKIKYGHICKQGPVFYANEVEI
jgi:dihydroorotate dehydrogenase electron transfer subunit